MTDKPITVGRKHIDSRFVHDFTDNKTNEYYFVRAHVWPSMQPDFPHNANIILSRKRGAVIHASCQPRSQGLSSPHPKGSEGRKTLAQADHVSW